MPSDKGKNQIPAKQGRRTSTTSLNGVTMPMLLPGIRIYSDPHNVTPIRQIQMARFDGKSWVLFGDVLGEK